MENDNTIRHEALPYGKLELLGIDREKADRLPEDVRRKLARGEMTPLIEVSLNVKNGNVLKLPVRLQLTRDPDGKELLLAYPMFRGQKIDRDDQFNLTNSETDRLMEGEVIRKNVEIGGEKSNRYLQLDPETRHILHRKEEDVFIEQKLRDMEKVNDIQLGTQQKEQAREGKPVELDVGGEKVSVGLDLREPQGFRVMKGDLKEWDRQQKLKYDDVHPEYVGLVMTDKNRWEYRKVVEEDEKERAIRIGKPKEQGGGLKL